VDNAQENGDSSSLADSSILEDAPIIDGYQPDYPVVEYPDYVVETEGENKYQSYKMQAPSKNASVTEYQDYALQQIDAYLGAIEQDETVEYDTTYITMQLQKRKYAIYTQESAEKIDLILIDVENIIKKYILDDETYYELNAIIANYLGVSAEENQISYYYGKYGNDYFYADFSSMLAAVYLETKIGNCSFIANAGHTYLRVWTKGDTDTINIDQAHSNGMITSEQAVELFEIEIIRRSGGGVSTYHGNGNDGAYVFSTTLFEAYSQGQPFVINFGANRNIKVCDKVRSEGYFPITFISTDAFRRMPIGVVSVYFGISDNNGTVLSSTSFLTENSEDFSLEFLMPSIINFNANGKAASLSLGNSPLHKVLLNSTDENGNQTLVLSEAGGWLQVFLTLEYENGYTPTYYSEKLYYSLESKEYLETLNAYEYRYNFSLEHTPNTKG